MTPEQVDQLLCTLACWDRETLVRQMLVYPSRFPVDLTPEYLRSQSADKLRHVFFALCLQNRRLPVSVDYAADGIAAPMRLAA